MIKHTLALIGLTLSLGANASLVDSIAALNPGDQYRVLFVTSTTTIATSSDIGYYNTIANNDGTTGSVTSGLGLTWNALASTPTTDACTNTGSCTPNAAPISIFNTQGDLLASTYNDLWDGTLASPVGYNEDGGLYDRTFVWTGTNTDGRAFDGFELGSESGFSVGGRATDFIPSSNWVADDYQGSGYGDVDFNLEGLYAISSVATVVPIPAAAWLFGSALLGLAGVARRKKA